MEIEIGLWVKSAQSGTVYEVTADASRSHGAGYWQLTVREPGPLGARRRSVGENTYIFAAWMGLNCEIVRRPSATPPSGDGEMFMLVADGQGGVLGQRLHDGTIDELVEWASALCAETPAAIVEWWGCDPQLYDERGEIIGLDSSPDMTAVLMDSALVWAET